MSDGAVRLHIRLMGTPEAFGGGISLVLNQLKSRGLLFYLAATGQPHTREHLATLLWGESGQSEAYHSLRSCLYHLRKALQAAQLDEVLISDGDLLRLDLSASRCDVIEFHRLALGDESSPPRL
jgi:DNA-binding SARP family transcriptional activator